MLKKALLPSKIEQLPDNTETIVYKSTAKLNKEEFSEYIREIEQYCRDENIVIDHLLEEMPYANANVSE